MTDHQESLFDVDELAREAVRATPWTGAPLAYVTDYHGPDELEEAFRRYQAQHGGFASVPNSHMWTKRSRTSG